ncbi:MAG: hypothetical protein HBSAPP03_04460 [Phycisphaerae bacterium]|nr:MAG: hypothetical protein HBSAPP03_04460 [Phycisphaerae bacterium]
MSQAGQSQLESLFHAARSLPREQRTLFLMAQCEDTALRAEVLQLLACADGPSVVEKLSDADAPVVPGFRIMEVLGEGGFGIVYRAEQQHPVRRIVAIKVARWSAPGARHHERFDQEMQILASLEHPGIARLYEVGTTADGRPFVVMECIRGASITEYCAARDNTVRERIELLASVCEAVQYAHQNGVIHRDLKPANILIVEADGRVEPRVIDFGVAKWSRPEADPGLTLAGNLIGTPAYMSPEQARLERTDIRTDVFALGAILYELLVGAAPLYAACAPDAAMDGLLKRAREARFPVASVAAGRRVGRNAAAMLRGELDAILDKALQPSPADRYASVAELAADLRRYLADKPVLAARATPWAAVRRFARHHRLGVMVAGMMLGVLVAGLVGLSVGLVRAQREADGAMAQCDMLVETLTRADPLAYGANATVRELLDVASAQLTLREATIRRDVLAKTRAVLGRAYAGLGLSEEAARELHASLGVPAGDDARTPAARADVLREYADALRQREEWEASDRALAEAAALIPGRSREEQIERVRVLRSRSNLWAAMQRLDQALTDAAAAVRQADELNDCPLSLRLHCYAWHGALLRTRERLAESEAVIRGALEMAVRALGRRHPQTAMILTDLADTLLFSGYPQEAERLAREALEVREATLGPTHPHTINSVVTLAACCAEIGRFDDADRLRQRALMARAESSGHGSESVAVVHYLAGLEALDRGDYAAAVGELRIRVDCLESRSDEPPIALATSRITYAAALVLNGDLDRAAAQLDLVQCSWPRATLNPSVELLMDACWAALQHRRNSSDADPGHAASIREATNQAPMLASRKRLILCLMDSGACTTQ